MGGLSVAIVGATGAVGGEFLRIFEKRDFPVRELKLLASARSVGKKLAFKGREYEVEELTADAFKGIDIAFFSAGASRSKEFVPAALAAGAYVIDNSSAFRADDDIPLIIPEINAHAAKPNDRVFPVGNCSAIVVMMAVAPLRKLGKIDRLIVSTYQSASGGGAAMMAELVSQTAEAATGKPVTPGKLREQYAFNLFNHNTAINEHGYNEEEWKVIQECRKTLEMATLKVNVTCVRVPVLRSHSASITVEFEGPAPSEDAVRRALESAPGVQVIDDRDMNDFPTPLKSSEQDDVLVGRIRQDVSNPNAICLFASGDQLLKGAALNAVQIAEQIVIPRLAVTA